MIVKIQVRRGLSTQWTSVNPILSSGEFGYETDTGKLKIGGGTTAWVDLEYTLNPEVIELLVEEANEAKDIAVTKASEAVVSASLAGDKATFATTEANRAELAVSMGVPNGGPISTSSSPETGTTNRVYFPTASGTYTNFSGLVVDITAGLNIILGNSTGGFQKIVVPLSLAGYLSLSTVTYFPTSKNVFNKNGIVNGQYVSATSDASILSSGLWKMSGLIPIYSGLISISGLGSIHHGLGYRINDINGTLLERGTVPIDATSFQFTVTNPVSHTLQFSVKSSKSGDNTNVDLIQVEQGVYTTYTAYTEGPLKVSGNNIVAKQGTNQEPSEPLDIITKRYFDSRSQVELKNKKVLIFGDSTTETLSDGGAIVNTWPSVFTLNNQTVLYNYSRSGASFTDWAFTNARQQFSTQVTDALASSLSPDIIIVSIGTNDYSRVANFGDFDATMAKTIASLDKSKILEAMRSGFYRIQETYITPKKFCIIPIQRKVYPVGASDGEWLRDGIRKMANRYGFIVIEGYDESGVVSDFENDGTNGRYLADGIHPNTDGKNLISAFITSKIKNGYF